jgi:hypothetical protein
MLVRVARMNTSPMPDQKARSDSENEPLSAPTPQLKQGDKTIQEFVTEQFNAVNQRLDEVETRLTRQLTTVIDMLKATAQRM